MSKTETVKHIINGYGVTTPNDIWGMINITIQLKKAIIVMELLRRQLKQHRVISILIYLVIEMGVSRIGCGWNSTDIILRNLQ